MKIGLHMIVREEEDNILNCLNSCNGLVDFTVVAVDSKKESDKTYNLIKDRENTYVYRQAWNNSFADARNDSLYKLLEKYPNVDYICWIYADDTWGTEYQGSISHETLRQRLEHQKPNVINNTYIYAEDVASNKPNLSYLRLRMFSHTPSSPPNFIWEGVAHETLVQTNTSTYQTLSWSDWILIHNRNKNIDWKNKTRRNIDMLEKAVKENPNNTRTLFYLAREYKDYGDIEKSIVNFMKYINKSNFTLEKYQALLDLAGLFQLQDDYHSAEMSLRQAMDLMPEIGFASNSMGDLYMKQNKPEIARMYYAMSIYAPHGPVLFDYIPFRTYIPHKSMSLACVYSGMLEEAIKHHEIAKSMAPGDIGIKYNDPWLIDNSKEFPEQLSWLSAFDTSYNNKTYTDLKTEKIKNLTTVEDWIINSNNLPWYSYLLGNDITIINVEKTQKNKEFMESNLWRTIFINQTLTMEILESCKDIFIDKSPIAIIIKDFGDWKIKNIVANYLFKNSNINLYRNFELSKIDSSIDKKEGLGILIRE